MNSESLKMENLNSSFASFAEAFRNQNFSPLRAISNITMKEELNLGLNMREKTEYEK